MHAHLKAGWMYSDYAGQHGGWELDTGDGLSRIVVRQGRHWDGFVVRQRDGFTLHNNTYRTRNDAMRAVSLVAM